MTKEQFEKIRDEMAERFALEMQPECLEDKLTFINIYTIGFNAASEILLKELEAKEAALKEAREVLTEYEKARSGE